MDPGKAQGAPAKQEDLDHGQDAHEQRGLSMLACSEIGKILDEKLDKKLSTLKEDLATKTCIESLRETIIEQNTKIETLEAKVVLLESYIKCIERNEELTKRHEDSLESNEERIEQLELKADDMEQYQRRLCLRINGVEQEADESGSKCLQKVKKIFKEDLKVDISDSVIDRAHRIGKEREDTETSKKHRAIIVRFTTWRHKTAVYRARKKCNDYKFRLDLTHRRAKLLEKANEWLKDKSSCFAMADVNCRLCLKLEDGKFYYFDTEYDLIDLLKYE